MPRCLNERKLCMARFEDLTGQRFGRLVALERDAASCGRPKWKCMCDCGNTVSVYASNLKRGSSKSCGCLQRALLSARKTVHSGWANKDKLYNVWHGIKKRCQCETDPHYKNYGARGIGLCAEWEEYNEFRSWAYEHGYREGLSLDRIDVDGHYEPANCRWTDNYTQQNNKRNNIRYTYNNETHTLKEWSRMLGINYQTLYSRLTRHGMTFENAIQRT